MIGLAGDCNELIIDFEKFLENIKTCFNTNFDDYLIVFHLFTAQLTWFLNL